MSDHNHRPLGIVSDIINNLPGRKRFGIYSILPLCFLAGAVLEFSMIHWTVGETNFYRIYKRNQVERLSQAALDDYIKKKESASEGGSNS